jgi:hypothetical protein
MTTVQSGFGQNGLCPVIGSHLSDRVCELPGRDLRLPTIYEAFNHPLNSSANGRSFYIKQSLNKDSMQQAHELEKSLKTPLGDARQVSDLGKDIFEHLNSN